MGHFRLRGAGALGIAVGLVIGVSSAAHADSAPPGTIGAFPTWSLAHSTVSGQTFDGAAAFSDASGFPAVSWTTNASTAQVPSGQSAYLGATTGFGQYFGSTRLQPYLYLSPASGGPSTTTITFAAPPPAGWGFAVGDIDADFVEIIPKDSANTVLPGSDLGAQDTGGTPRLNYCANSPRPSSCSGPGPFLDAPTWHPTGVTVGGDPYSTPVVLGSGTDTSGAYDWFLPGTDVRSLTFVFHVQSGSPIFQVWLAALAPSSVISGTVRPAPGAVVPDGTSVTLEHDNGSAILDLQGEPVVEPVAPDGAFTFTTEQGIDELAFTVPPGYAPIPAERVAATAATVVADPVTLTRELAPTGVEVGGVGALGLLMIAAGATVLLLSRRRNGARRATSG